MSPRRPKGPSSMGKKRMRRLKKCMQQVYRIWMYMIQSVGKFTRSRRRKATKVFCWAFLPSRQNCPDRLRFRLQSCQLRWHLADVDACRALRTSKHAGICLQLLHSHEKVLKNQRHRHWLQDHRFFKSIWLCSSGDELGSRHQHLPAVRAALLYFLPILHFHPPATPPKHFQSTKVVDVSFRKPPWTHLYLN